MKTITFSALLLLTTISFSSFIVSQKQNNTKLTGIESFGIHRQGKEICLTWKASASSVSFRVERSEDGEFFNPVHTARSNNAKSYQFIDNSSSIGTVYYRLVYVDAEGSEKRSAIERIVLEHRG